MSEVLSLLSDAVGLSGVWVPDDDCAWVYQLQSVPHITGWWWDDDSVWESDLPRVAGHLGREGLCGHNGDGILAICRG